MACWICTFGSAYSSTLDEKSAIRYFHALVNGFAMMMSSRQLHAPAPPHVRGDLMVPGRRARIHPARSTRGRFPAVPGPDQAHFGVPPEPATPADPSPSRSSRPATDTFGASAAVALGYSGGPRSAFGRPPAPATAAPGPGGFMTSRHGTGTGGRRVAPWIIVTIVVAVLVAGGVVAYVLITRDNKEGATCSGQVVLPIVAAPGAAPAIEAAAETFDATGPVARSTCVTTEVTTVPGANAAAALAGGWVGQPSAGPAVWFPDSAGDLAALEATHSAMTAGRNPAPMAGSPVVLAIRTQDADAVKSANLQWRDLPTAAGPNGSVTLPNNRKLILALPDPTTNRATSYALQSVLSGTTAGPIDPATVAATAGQLAEFAQLSAQTQGLTAVGLGGGTVGDQIYGVPITASWVDPTLDAAASTFLAYLRGPAGPSAFTEHGLKVGADTGVQIADAGSAVATALAAAVGGAPGNAPGTA